MKVFGQKKRFGNSFKNNKRNEKRPKYFNQSNKQSISDEEIVHQLFVDDKKSSSPNSKTNTTTPDTKNNDNNGNNNTLTPENENNILNTLEDTSHKHSSQNYSFSVDKKKIIIILNASSLKIYHMIR